MATKVVTSQQPQLIDDEDAAAPETDDIISYTAVLLTQGKHRFFTVAMPSEVLAATCVVDLRSTNPMDGFQRRLEEKRAREIAEYIDHGFGTIPSSIILSAQPDAQLQYIRKARTIKFRNTPRSFLIIDGQHRIYGFKLAKETLRVPVVIYNNLSRTEECKLFMDINTKQRPVPSELILDIKRLAETETNVEGLMRDVFDALNTEPDSPLLGLLSPSERQSGKLSRTTFNSSLESIWSAFAGSDADQVYKALSAFLHACLAGLRANKAEARITSPNLFKALMRLFPDAAERVLIRNGEYSFQNFDDVLAPVFRRVKKADFQKPVSSHRQFHNVLRDALSAGFTLGRASV